MSEWRECSLGELGVVVTGKTPSKNHPEDWGNVMPFITPSDFKNYGKKARNSERKLSERGIERLRNKVLPKDSILVTCIGSDMGKVVMNNVDAISNQQINSIIPSSQIVSNNFLYYRLVAMYETLRIYGGDGTAVPIVNKGDFENLETSVPPLPEQKAIAEVLSSLDDKIDLLHRQNKTLEQMAESLFRQWFVEEAGEETTLGEVIETTSGGTPSRKNRKFYENGVYSWVKSKELTGSFILETEEHISDAALEKSSAKLLPKHSVLIAMYGATVGEYSIISDQMTCNQAICALKPNSNYPYTFLFMFVKVMKEEIINMAVGSAQQNISQILIKSLPVASPNEKINEFHIKTKNSFKKIENNIKQIRTIESLRDTLLPKLMSGEMRVAL